MPYRLRIEGDDGLSVDRMVDKQLVLRMLALDEWSIAALTNTPPERIVEGPKLGRHDGAANEASAFLLASNARTNMAKIATLGLYLHSQGHSSFGPTQIKALFAECGEPPPANLGRDFERAKRLGWIASDPKERGHWFVTNEARRVHASAFSDERAPKRSSKPRRTSSKVSSKKEVPPDVTAIPSDTTSTKPKQSAPATDRKPKHAAPSSGIGHDVPSDGPMGIIDQLCTSEFFTEWRSTPDILQEAARQGYTLKRTDTTSLLPKYTRKHVLVRERRLPSGGTKSVWHYRLRANPAS